MTNRELIDETVEYYSTDPSRRAFSGILHCVYKTNDNKKCAIGRLIDEDILKREDLTWEYLNNAGSLSNLEESLSVNRLHIDNILYQKYRGMPTNLLEDIQDFHDSSGYWDNGGLTSSGKYSVQELIEKYDNIK